MSNKQIFAALEIADHEIRLVVSELHNLKFNVLKVERVAIDGIEELMIIDHETVIEGIKKAVQNASKMIGVPIKRVLLLIPSLAAKKITKKITVKPVGLRISINDIQSALKLALNAPIPENLELVNFAYMRYNVNGFATRRMPINEKADTLTVEVDLLCADKEMVWQYVKCIEKAELEIIDIYLDTYAFCNEAALFEKAVGQYLYLIRLEKDSTTLSLLANGRIENSVVIHNGYGSVVDHIVEQCHLSTDVADRLLRYNCKMISKVSDSPIYLWSYDNKTHTISDEELANLARLKLTEWIDEIKDISEEILKQEKVMGIVYGEGAIIQQLSEFISNALNIKFSLYVPDTLGIRDGALASVAGAFYCYNDHESLRSNSLYSVDNDAFIKMANSVKTVEVVEKDDTLTNRFKKLFK